MQPRNRAMLRFLMQSYRKKKIGLAYEGIYLGILSQLDNRSDLASSGSCTHQYDVLPKEP